jgi:hypothetical protein
MCLWSRSIPNFTYLALLVRGLRHALSSLARTLGSCVRIPLRAWMLGVCMRLFCVCAVLCIGIGLATGDHSSKESYRLWKMITELNKRPGPWISWKSHWRKKSSVSSLVIAISSNYEENFRTAVMLLFYILHQERERESCTVALFSKIYSFTLFQQPNLNVL